jgi:hypothetical protein
MSYEIIIHGYRTQTSIECTTVITIVLSVTSDLDPHVIRWLWFGNCHYFGFGCFLENFGSLWIVYLPGLVKQFHLVI